MSDHDDGKVGAVDLDGMTTQQLTALIAAAETATAIQRTFVRYLEELAIMAAYATGLRHSGCGPRNIRTSATAGCSLATPYETVLGSVSV